MCVKDLSVWNGIEKNPKNSISKFQLCHNFQCFDNEGWFLLQLEVNMN